MPSSRSYKKKIPPWDAGMDWEPLQLPDPPPPKKVPEAEFRVPTPVEFGLCVRARRHQLKIGQLDLAARAGVSRQWIVSLERGKGGLELALVLRTLAILNLDLRLLVWAPPDWSVPLTAAAGTAARPYGKGRLWRVAPKWGKE